MTYFLTSVNLGNTLRVLSTIFVVWSYCYWTVLDATLSSESTHTENTRGVPHRSINNVKPLEISLSQVANTCKSVPSRRPLLVVSSMDGTVTTLDLSDNGRKQWDLDAGTGPLLSSSLSKINENSEILDGAKRILPSLDGDLFTWDGSNLEACPFSTDSLISSSFKLSDNTMVVGSKSTRTYGINANTGQLVYSCSPDECTTMGAEPADDEDVIVTKFQQHVVRALDQRTGAEKWNYSVGQHDVKYIVGHAPSESDADVCFQPEEMLESLNLPELRISMEYNMIFGLKHSNPREVAWSHEFSSDIANAWTIIDGQVKELDILSLDIDPTLSQQQTLIPYAEPIMPSFIGYFEDQLYVRPSRSFSQQSEESATSVPLIADETGYGLVPRIQWRPYLSSADSRTPVLLAHGRESNNIGETIGPVAKSGDTGEWSQYPFDVGYPIPWLSNKCPKVSLVGPKQKPKPAFVDNESLSPGRNGPDIFMGLSVWTWWREMLVSSIIMAIAWQLLYHFVLKATCDVPVDSAQSEVAVAEEAVKVQTFPETFPTQEYKSRYLSDFHHQECLGKGGFGIVFQAKNKVDENNYAIKRICLPHREEAREKVLREARALARLEHLGIVRYFQSWIEEPPPGWQDRHDKLFIGDRSTDGPMTSLVSSATFNKDSQLLRDEARFFKQTSMENDPRAFGGGDSLSFDIANKKDFSESGGFCVDADNEDESGSFSIEFKSDVASPATLEIIGLVGGDSHSTSENAISTSLPFSRYTTGVGANIAEEKSNSFEIVFEDSGCSDEIQSSASGSDGKRRVQSSISNTDENQLYKIENESSNNNQSAISHSQKDTNSKKPNIYLYIQMQLCQKETLKDWLNQNIENRDHNRVLHMFQQILGAVSYVHQCGMIHRDLKPSNIFFAMDGSVKVGDFGLVTAMDTELKAELVSEEELESSGRHHTSQVGTQLYMSPEQIKGESYDHKVDIFSLGMIMFELLYPFSTQMERISVLCNAKRKLQFPKKFSEEMHSETKLVMWLLSPNPANRPNTDEIVDSSHFKTLYKNFIPPVDRSRSRYSSSQS